jgi:hypothetical protein
MALARIMTVRFIVFSKLPERPTAYSKQPEALTTAGFYF